MQDLATYSELARAEIESLQADGYNLTPEEIIRINALGWAVEYPEARLSLARGNPVSVGGVTLWPTTLHAQDWFDRVGCRLHGARVQTYALAYAMAYGYSEGNELDATGAKALACVLAFAARLRCRFAELNEALSQIIMQDEDHEMPPHKDDAPPISRGELSVIFAASLGDNPEFWERRCASSYAFDVLRTVQMQNMEDGRRHGADPRIVATRALGWAVEKIRRKADG